MVLLKVIRFVYQETSNITISTTIGADEGEAGHNTVRGFVCGFEGDTAGDIAATDRDAKDGIDYNAEGDVLRVKLDPFGDASGFIGNNGNRAEDLAYSNCKHVRPRAFFSDRTANTKQLVGQTKRYPQKSDLIRSYISAAQQLATMACVYTALGTNLGDKLVNLENALTMLSQLVGPVQVTSRLYTTRAQYVEDQPVFLNLVARLKTELKPIELLEALKTIEREIGRTRSLRYGPRLIDVDILFFDDLTLKTNTKEGPLIIPHERISERDFVLAPMCDVAPDLLHPVLKQSMQCLYDALKNGTQRCIVPVPMLPVDKNAPWSLGSKTLIMGIVNVTPDSFSDGAELETTGAAVEKALEMERAGVDIIDIGGESSRPGAEPVTEEEELRRVLPVICGIREKSKIAISVDTTKAEVARQAVGAGANMVNDISAGLNDDAMLATVAMLRVPIVLMHMRGTPQTMTSLKEYENVVAEVAEVLHERVIAAEAAGIFRWNIIVDPGIGFAKARCLNLKLLRKLSVVKKLCQGLPLLVGPSRKGFIGEICGRSEPKDRLWGTAATCCAAIEQGADILRVHDGAEMVDVAKMSDAIWREE
ncbi:unnamed protein product [Peronospora belbahrii]|uniref:Pterin-binding domain-containing protein n=1 Tax=Peronospora belbahrii TaxID=622444 RepID=A0ABN8D5X7_9STRA|nr:unnamed protein product [Peronospora belbahrii]